VVDEWTVSMNHWWNDHDMGKLTYLQRNVLQCHCAYYKSHMDWPGLKQPPQWEAGGYPWEPWYGHVLLRNRIVCRGSKVKWCWCKRQEKFNIWVQCYFYRYGSHVLGHWVLNVELHLLVYTVVNIICVVIRSVLFWILYDRANIIPF